MRSGGHDAVTNFRVLMEVYAGGPLPAWQQVADTERRRQFAAGDLVYGTSDTDSRVHLVLAGLVRAEVPGDKGYHTVGFYEEGELVANVEALLGLNWVRRLIDSQVNPRLNAAVRDLGPGAVTRAVAHEPTEVASFDLEVLTGLALRDPAWSRAMLTYFTLYSLILRQASYQRRRLSIQAQYDELLRQRPELVRRLRQKDIAGLLGVSESGLSRILKTSGS